MSTELDRLLDTVQSRKCEITLDVADCTEDQKARIRATLEARGLHLSGTDRWYLVRDLRDLQAKTQANT